MPEKKRKSAGDVANPRPHKKAAVAGPRDTVKVSLHEDAETWLPVLASTPGLSLPAKASFKAYTKTRHNSQSKRPTAELLLHSDAHPKLDYTAREEASAVSESHLKHYVGVYDPIQHKLELVEARKLVVRSTLRSARAIEATSEKADRDEYTSSFAVRNALGLAFGTKKSQKAIQAMTTNAIQPSPSKPKPSQLQSQSSPSKPTLDPLAEAVVSSMASATASMPTREQMQSSIDESKPRPRPNLAATTPAEVYPTEQLVGGANILAQIGVKEWIDTITAGKDVPTKSRFVAHRLVRVVESEQVKMVKALKYLLLLVEWFNGLKPKGKVGKLVPKMEEMGSLVSRWGSEVVAGLGRRFAEGGTLNRHAQDNVLTHLLALTLTIDNFSTDTHDIMHDLSLTPRDMKKYYPELGATVVRPTETDRAKKKITKAEAASHQIARLRLPLVFPRPKTVVGGRGKR